MSEAELSATLTKLEAFTSVDEFMSNDKWMRPSLR
jgi:hypothetical protein